MDLTNVGGPNKVLMDLNLLKDNSLSQSIGINDNVVAGEKEIPVTIVDKNGENHKALGNLTVKSKVGVGPLDFGFDESRIYFTVTDRFFNGDKNNDDPHGNNYYKKNPYTYHGGDLKQHQPLFLFHYHVLYLLMFLSHPLFLNVDLIFQNP